MQPTQQQQQSLYEKRRQILSRYNELDGRANKLQRLTPSDSSSIPRSSQNFQRADTPTDTPTPTDLPDLDQHEQPPVVDPHPTRRRRCGREIVYVRAPLSRLQTRDTTNAFWHRTLVCYWGYAKPLNSPDVPPSEICEEFDHLPVNWFTRIHDQAWEMGASVVVGGDENVFATILAMKSRRADGCILPSTVVHVCRPFNGHLKLQKAWEKWITMRGRKSRDRTSAATSVAQSLVSPSIVSEEQPYPAPSDLHRVVTPLWLQLCVEDKHHYPETGFAFFRPPLGHAYTPLLFRVKKSVRRLNVMLLGAHGNTKPSVRGSADYYLWQAGIERYLGGAMFPSKRLHLPVSQPDGDASVMREYAVAQANSITFEPFCNYQGVTSDLRVHDRSHDLPDIVVCLHGHNDVMNFVAQIGSTNLSRLQFNVKTTIQMMILLRADIPFLTFRYITDCYTKTSVLSSDGYSLNERLRRALETLINNFQAVLPMPISGSNPGSAATSRASSRNPSTRPSLSGAKNGEWWRFNSESLFDTLVSPEAVLEPQTPGGLQESKMVWSQAFGSEEVVDPACAVSVTRGVSWAPDLPRLRIAVSPLTLAEFPHFQDAAFQMLPVEKSGFVIEPFAHELCHIVCAIESLLFRPARDLLTNHRACAECDTFPDQLWSALVTETSTALAYQPIEAGLLAEGLPGCRLLPHTSARFREADVCLLVMQRERYTLNMRLTLLRDSYAHYFADSTDLPLRPTCVGDLLARIVSRHLRDILAATRPVPPDALLAIARLASHLLRQERTMTASTTMNVRGCIDVELLKRQDDFANVAKLLYAPQKPLADSAIDALKEAIIRTTAKYICEHCLVTIEAARENLPPNLLRHIDAYRRIVGTVDKTDADMDGTCATKSLDGPIEASQTALPPLEYEMSYGRQKSRQSLINGNMDRMRALEDESDTISRRVISRLCAKWSFMKDAHETARMKVLTEMLEASARNLT